MSIQYMTGKLKPSFIKLCIEEAKKSTFRHRVGAVIFNKSKVLSKGYNSACKGAKNLHPRYQHWEGSVHAEVDAILKARKDLKGSDTVVVRINKKGEFKLAKPCKHCEMYLRHIGIKRVFYSINTYPFFEAMKL